MALQRFIEEGHGWIGIHAAGLTGRDVRSGEWAKSLLSYLLFPRWLTKPQ